MNLEPLALAFAPAIVDLGTVARAWREANLRRASSNRVSAELGEPRGQA